jgi:hypothetical protein
MSKPKLTAKQQSVVELVEALFRELSDSDPVVAREILRRIAFDGQRAGGKARALNDPVSKIINEEAFESFKGIMAGGHGNEIWRRFKGRRVFNESKIRKLIVEDLGRQDISAADIPSDEALKLHVARWLPESLV